MSWAVEAIEDNLATGVIISPFDTPVTPTHMRKSAEELSTACRDSDSRLIFDPATYALELPGFDKLDFYAGWRLWGPSRDLLDAASRAEHITRCRVAQENLGSELVAPTVSISSPMGPDARLALTIARDAREDGCDWLAIVGTEDFWRHGLELDEFIGEIAALKPTGVVITVLRARQAYPVEADAREMFGVLRTVFALSARSEVVLSHGDLAALPAVAAGAAGLGTGWDLGQRAMCPERFQRSSGGGGSVKRVTYRELLSSYMGVHPDALATADSGLSDEMIAGPIPADLVAAWRHHLETVNYWINHLSGVDAGERRAKLLLALYRQAARNHRRVRTVYPLPISEQQWLSAARAGLLTWLADERAN
ncbi:MAG: hypothetical protein AAGA90_00820 [Actinomycetota bacterium]